MSSIEALTERITPEDEVNWNVVTLIVQGYSSRHQEEVAGCIIHVQKLRDELKTQFGEWGVESRTRHIFELPTGLNMALTTKYPKVLKDENLKHFLGLFPQFQVAEKL